MKTYEETIQTVATDAFSDYMGGGAVRFTECLIIAWIYEIDPRKVSADFETAFHVIKLNYYASRA